MLFQPLVNRQGGDILESILENTAPSGGIVQTCFTGLNMAAGSAQKNIGTVDAGWIVAQPQPLQPPGGLRVPADLPLCIVGTEGMLRIAHALPAGVYVFIRRKDQHMSQAAAIPMGTIQRKSQIQSGSYALCERIHLCIVTEGRILLVKQTQTVINVLLVQQRVIQPRDLAGIDEHVFIVQNFLVTQESQQLLS